MPRAPSEEPSGLVYRPGFMSAEEERTAIAVLDESHEVVPTDPLPARLEWLRERCAALAEVEPERFEQVLVTRYPPGAGIGWHRDAPMFGSRIAGVSLGSECRMRFQRGKGEERRVWDLELAPRSAYLITGSARWAWQHSIPSAPDLRYSITFRTLRRDRPAR